jgi:glyoxylase-like metal-dependent hydrolase (beta-lactamase superfamily II)
MINIRNAIIGMCATNTYFVWDDVTGEGVIIDPAGDSQRIISRADSYGFKVVGILLTHGHFDHVLALDDIRDKYSVKAYIGVDEADVLANPMLNLTGSFMGEPIAYKADELLSDGEEILLGGMKIKAIKVPGHTPGGMCYYFQDYAVVFSGDTLFAGSIGRSDFPGGSGFALIQGIQKSLYVLPDETKVYPGHGDDTTIEYEKVHNPFVHI